MCIACTTSVAIVTLGLGYLAKKGLDKKEEEEEIDE